MTVEQAINELGRHLDFDAEAHKYTYKGQEMVSVTTLVKPYFPFNADEIAQKSSEGSNPKYAGKSVEEIKQMWSDKADFGTGVHDTIENYLAGEFVTLDNTTEVAGFSYAQRLKFEQALPEVKVVAPQWGIAGTVDLLVKIDGRWYIYDWKTDEKIRQEGYKGEECGGLLTGFPACNFTKYRLQLSIYRLILETVYGIPIAGVKVVHLHSRGSKEYNIDYLVDYAMMLVANHAGQSKELWPLTEAMWI